MVRRTTAVDESLTLATGGAGGASCTGRPLRGTSLSGFDGGHGGASTSALESACAGGGGGGASLVIAGIEPSQTPILVAGGGGGAGGAYPGSPGGAGPFRDAGPSGQNGNDCVEAMGRGGGGGGYPFGGAERACSMNGGGGQSFAPGGFTAAGQGSTPGSPDDPERPGRAGEGGAYDESTGSNRAAEPGAIVYRLTRADLDPDPFSFESVLAADAGSEVHSVMVTPTGFDGPASVRVAGAGAPALSVAGRSFSPSETIRPGDTLQLRQTASPLPNATRTAVVLLGNAAVEWEVRTKPGETLAAGCGCSAPGTHEAALLCLQVAAVLGALASRRRR